LIVYADTSFQIAAYIVDIHSSAVVRSLSARPQLCLTPFSRSEVANAIHRQTFTGQLSLAAAQRAWHSFEGDCAAGVWQAVAFPNPAWESCVDLARQFAHTLGVRTLDSLHVACALALKVDRFWTLDDRQARLAESVGLNTDAG
jgi:predicted nucleic acid-binding protein